MTGALLGRSLRFGVIGAVFSCGIVVASPAAAQSDEASLDESEDVVPSPPQASTKPWAEGVTREAQAAALEAFKQGNDFFGTRQYGEALKHYREALGHWKHPAVHFNTAVCQVNLDQPIEAYTNIQAALEYEDAPLGKELYAQGLTYKKLLKDRLGNLTVSASQAGTKVSLDGEELLTAPGEQSRILLPGKHQIVGELEGHFTFTRTVQVDPGKPTEVDVKLIALNDATEFKRPMPVLLPWGVLGGGLLVGGGGFLMRTIATRKIDRYDTWIEDNCQGTGCSSDLIPDAETKALNSGKSLDVASLVTMSVGGAVVLTGVTLLVLNSPRPVHPEESVASLRPRVIPSVGPDGGGVEVHLSF